MSAGKPKYLFTVTTFDADPDRVAIPHGGRIGLCPPCAKTHGVTDDNRVQNSEWMGAAAVLAAGQGRQAFSF